jgi:hypothetical protein
MVCLPVSFPETIEMHNTDHQPELLTQLLLDGATLGLWCLAASELKLVEDGFAFAFFRCSSSMRRSWPLGETGEVKWFEVVVSHVRHGLIGVQMCSMLNIPTKSYRTEFSTTSTLPKQGIQIVLHLHKCPFAHSRFRGFLML